MIEFGIDQRICYKCKIEKPINEFPKHKSRFGGHDYMCKLCHKKYYKSYYEDNSKKNRKHSRKYYWDHKMEKKKNIEKYKKENNDKYQRQKYIALQIYSNGYMKCENCGIDNTDVLTINHINGGGNKERKEKRYTKIYDFVA